MKRSLGVALLIDHARHIVQGGGFALHIAYALPDFQGLLPELECSLGVALARDHPGHLVQGSGFALPIAYALLDFQGLLPELECSLDVALARHKPPEVVESCRFLSLIRWGTAGKSPLIVAPGGLGITEYYFGARNGPQNPIVVKRRQDQAAQRDCFQVAAAIDPVRSDFSSRADGQLLFAGRQRHPHYLQRAVFQPPLRIAPPHL